MNHKNRYYFPNNNDYDFKTLNKFQYKPPNNTGIILAIIGGILTTIGDGLSTIGAIVQLDIDNSIDFQSQLDDFMLAQENEKEKAKMSDQIEIIREQVNDIDTLREQLKEIEEIKEQLKEIRDIKEQLKEIKDNKEQDKIIDDFKELLKQFEEIIKCNNKKE